jgi:hypothetical protein
LYAQALPGLTGSFETSIARPLAVKIVREQASACPTAANERVYYAASQTLGENKIANKTFGYIVSNAGTSTTITAMVIGF